MTSKPRILEKIFRAVKERRLFRAVEGRIIHSFLYRLFWERFMLRRRLPMVESEFPKIWSLTNTVDTLIKGASICRLGDGELMIILKYSIGFQVYSKKLAQRLSEILAFPTNENLIVGLYPFRIGTPHETRLSNGFLYTEQFYAKYWKRLRNIIVQKEYGNPFVSRAAVFHEVPLEKIRSIWAQRDVIFVVGKNSRFFLDPRLFDNIHSAEYIYVQAKNCFEDYDEILKQALSHNKSKLFFISCGPTATVLAFDLAQQGYQALDMGHLPNCYKQYLGEEEMPEKTPLEST